MTATRSLLIVFCLLTAGLPGAAARQVSPPSPPPFLDPACIRFNDPTAVMGGEIVYAGFTAYEDALAHAGERGFGFYVHVWNFGDYLPRGWYASNYRILDWWTYDLPVPPPGYAWVRVGDDALLIDEFNGRVIQVVRYVFW